MKKDNFWKIFFQVFGTFGLIFILAIGWLKFSYLNKPDDTSRALAVGVTFDPSTDPYVNKIRALQPVVLTSGYLYQESIPFGFDDWSWDTKINWRSGEEVKDDSFAIKTEFLKPWSGIRLNSPFIDVSPYKSITLSVFPGPDMNEMYIELHDKYGNSMGKQSIGWYMADSKLVPNSWNSVEIPLENLVSSKSNSITGFSISSDKIGFAFIDSIHLDKKVLAHSKWIGTNSSSGGNWLGSDPFTGITQVTLPYSLGTTGGDLESWQNLFGQFEKFDDGIHIGPIAKKTTGSITVFGGGKDWSDYREEATVYWGMTNTFSLLARFQNDTNFVSCAYSNYGAVVQIYVVKNGVSTLIGQTPGLGIRSYEPWRDAKHALEVKGDRLSCYMDGEKVLSADLPEGISNGTAGFETWSSNSYDYPHKITSFDVSAI